jgi:hypothetical protein
MCRLLKVPPASTPGRIIRCRRGSERRGAGFVLGDRARCVFAQGGRLGDGEPSVHRADARRDRHGAHDAPTAARDPSLRSRLCRYPSYAFGKRCREAGIMPSMATVGDAYDNAMAERFFSTLEREVLSRRRLTSQAQAKMAIFDWLEGWYNPHRRHSSLGYRSPATTSAMCSKLFDSLPRISG